LVGHAARQSEGGGSVCRRVEWFGGAEITGFGSVVARLGIRDASAHTEYGLGSYLISDTKPRLEGPGIVVRECAVATASSVAFKNDSTRKTAGRRVRRVDADTEHVAVMLFQVGLKIVAQAVIDCELA